MTWKGDGVNVRVEISTAGDLITPSTVSQYPFLSSTGGIASGWTQYLAAGSNANEVNWTVTNNGQCISNALGSIPMGKEYGIERFFPVLANHQYYVGVDFRTMEAKDHANFQVRVYAYNGSTLIREVERYIYTKSDSGWSRAVVVAQPFTVANGYSGVTQIKVRFVVFGDFVQSRTDWGAQFANVWIADYDPSKKAAMVWRDVTCDLREVMTRYGRAQFTQRFDVATCSLVLLNTDGDYAYGDPQAFNLRPGRVLRVFADYQSVPYPLFFGIVDTITDGYALDGRAITTITAVDVSTLASQIPVAITSAAYPQSGTRINELLNLTGYDQRLINTGQFLMLPIKSSGSTVRDECGLTSDSENGLFYADRSGRICFDDRASKTYPDTWGNVTAEIVAGPHGDSMPVFDEVPTKSNAPIIDPFGIVTNWSNATVINRVTLARVGGTARQYDDADSQLAVGIKTYQRLDLVCAEDSTHNPLPVLANDILSLRADPSLKVNAVSFRPSATRDLGASNQYPWRWVLGAFLSWLVRVWYINSREEWGYATVVRIQSIEHRITIDDWVTTVAVDEQQAFTSFELSDAGWDFGLWDQSNWDGKPDWAKWGTGKWGVNSYG